MTDPIGEWITNLLHPMQKLPGKQRYKCFLQLLKASQDAPETVYPYWDSFAQELDDPNADHKYEAIHILANLARVDVEGKAKQTINRYLEMLTDQSYIVALNAANNVGKFAKANKDLQDLITHALLGLDESKHKHKDLLMSGAILSFNEYFEDIPDKEKILKFVQKLETGESPKARKLAKQFKKNHPT